MENISPNDMALFRAFNGGKEAEEVGQRSQEQTRKYSKEEYLHLSHVKRSELMCVDDQYAALAGKRLCQEVDERLKRSLLNSIIIPDILSLHDPLCNVPMKLLVHSGGRNTGALDMLLCVHRYYGFGGRTFTFRDSLIDRLLETDIGSKTPLEFLRLPYNNIYLEFGDKRIDRGMYLNDDTTGNHIVEGAYIMESDTHHIELKGQAKGEELFMFDALGIDMGQPMRVLQIFFTGSPIGKSGGLDDDTFLNVYVYIPNETTLTMDELIEKHIAFYTRNRQLQNTVNSFGKKVEGMSAENTANFIKMFKLLVSTLLYLNSDEPILEVANKYTEAMKRVNQLSPAKRRKALNKAIVSVNRTFVGEEHHGDGQFDYSDRKPASMHWRRGHYRTQSYGPKRSETKLIWIKPTIVNKSDDISLKVKNYDVH